MLKKLRKRFTSMLMLIVGAVLIVFYLVVVALMMITLTLNMRSSLHDFASEEYVSLYPDITADAEYDSTHVFPLYSEGVCVVRVSGDGTYTKLNIGQARMKSEVLSDVVKDVMSTDYTFGLLPSEMLFFYKNSSIDGTRIAFANASQYASYLGRMLIRGGVMCILAIIVIYIMSRFMARIFIKPVEKAWSQQQNFIADASHELKTPLTVILANTNILQEHKNDTIEAQYKWLESTQVEATHMKELVDKMLILAKSDNMKVNNMYSDVDMSELATRLYLQFEPIAFENGVILNTDIDKNIVIHGDQTSLNQIMHILIDNSVKYAGDSGEIFFSLKRKSGGCILSTRNPGVTIPQEDIPHLFERFYRSGKAHTAGKGYGLGLAICKNLAELHNAQISVLSDEHNGTVFTVSFPDGKKKIKKVK